MSIENVHARRILNSCGDPIVQVEICTTGHGGFRSTFTPDSHTGLCKAISDVNNVIGPQLIKSGMNVTRQKDIDDFLNKLTQAEAPNWKLHADAIMGVSIAVAEAGAEEKGVYLDQHISDIAGGKPPLTSPVPPFFLKGIYRVGNRLDNEDLMVHPNNATNFTEAIEARYRKYHALKKCIAAKHGLEVVDIRNKYLFSLVSPAEEALKRLSVAMKKLGYKREGQLEIVVEPAASLALEEFTTSVLWTTPYVRDRRFLTNKQNGSQASKADPSHGERVTGIQLAELYLAYLRVYPVVFDAHRFGQEWFVWVDIIKSFRVKMVADDLIVSNPDRSEVFNGMLLQAGLYASWGLWETDVACNLLS